jgi:hypothetical protein
MSQSEAAVSDLAGRLGVPAESIEVLRVESVMWPDGSMGCPEPGMSYTQAVVPGQRIVLSQGDRVYVYHAADLESPFLCASDDKDGGFDFVPPPRDS